MALFVLEPQVCTALVPHAVYHGGARGSRAGLRCWEVGAGFAGIEHQDIVLGDKAKTMLRSCACGARCCVRGQRRSSPTHLRCSRQVGRVHAAWIGARWTSVNAEPNITAFVSCVYECACLDRWVLSHAVLARGFIYLREDNKASLLCMDDVEAS